MSDWRNRYINEFRTMVGGDEYVFTRQRPPGYAIHTYSTWDVRRVGRDTPREFEVSAGAEEDPHALAELAADKARELDREEAEDFADVSAKAYRVLRAQLTGDRTHLCERDYIDVYTALGVPHLLYLLHWTCPGKVESSQ
ncbi:hypothetical protein Sa4125_30110 [Aureimonas sp. SA4125]|uniref:hypothetical protein n=1 Tax=Aureimonas sp. SA4125 TaxID=2826993 RepID=UPI001CC6DE99|nr:hypothetical protein [Aureimonas sp. SA4125]BDA85469.1 hypothetical protein Sa4125_30110 [Aureimonas sp. SA4125]